VLIRDTIIEDVSPIRFLGQEVVEAKPVVKDWIAGTPGDIDLDPMIIDSGSYRPIRHMSLSSIYPIVEGYKTYAGAGLRLELEDPVGFHHTSLTASYTPAPPIPADERWHVNWEHSYLNWSLNFNYNGADFYDLFGPTRTSRKGFAAGINYKRTLVYDRPRTMDYNIGLSGYWNLERLPDYQNVATSYGEFATLSAGLNYSNSTASIGAVDHEKGTRWQLRSNNTWVNGEVHPLLSGGFDLGFPLFIPHSALWLRTAAGYSPGDRDDPFDNFFFGGFGNNWVDVGPIKRYRQSSSFPGVELNEIAGTNYGKLMLEWALPAWRFRRMGTSMFYLTYARPALFATGIVTNMDHEAYRRELADFGAQIDFRFALMTHYRMTFSIGYATAVEDGRRSTDEWMFSLKVM
jgi:hypothetical protein